ncbi:MAG: choice-of-anchor D domain-containing protein, partial [Solirubrobacteraceae bacterium]
FGWGTGSPIVTSNQTSSGSALVWVVWSADRTGAGAQLRAYDPVPKGGSLGAPVFEAPIGTSTNYSMPGVGNDGRLYLGTRDGHLLAFGSPVAQSVTGSVSEFPTTTVSQSSTETLTITATEPVKVTSITSSAPHFTVGTPSDPLPAQLAQNHTITVPVTFSPAQAGLAGGEITVTTDSGPVSFSVSGSGQADSPLLQSSTSLVSMDGTAVGGHVTDTVTFSNAGNAPVQIISTDVPSPPFSTSGVPVPGTPAATIAPGDSMTVSINFDPTRAGRFSDEIQLLTQDGEDVEVGVAASAGSPGVLQFSNQNVDFGNVGVGSTATRTFTLTNGGGTDVVINKSKPPFGGAFSATTLLQEGTTLSPGQTISETVAFSPTTTAAASAGSWAITGDDTSGPHEVQFTGSGVAVGATPATATTPTPPDTPPVGARPRTVPSPRAPTVARVTTTNALGRAFITYTALVARTSTFTVQRQVAGARSHGRCVAPSPGHRHAARCLRWVTVATFSHHDRVGANHLRLTAMVAARRLTPGTYRLQSVLWDARGARYGFTATLRITRPKKA